MGDVKSRIKQHYRLLEEKNELITAETVKKACLGVQLQLRGRTLNDLLGITIKSGQ